MKCVLLGSCDPWGEKVLRSGMGAHFRVPIFTGVHWSRLVNYVPEKFRVSTFMAVATLER